MEPRRGSIEQIGTVSGENHGRAAPVVSGSSLSAYIAAGIRNCHETSNYNEGLEKINKGMNVLIREGSVAKDLEALIPLITPETLDFIALCTDDMNVDDMAQKGGHISHIIRKAIASGASPTAVYRIASYSAARIFGLKDRGLIAPGYRADALHSVQRKTVQAEDFQWATPDAGHSISQTH
ncbi:hypothetical protein FACS189474_1620 [Bacteroidia bacterium]|nr:hypothetical protein FACS189474_1620 [Bacteroidia bacterium]